MSILGIILMKITSLFFGLYWIKNAISKLKQPYMYFIAIRDYGVLTKSSLLIIFISFIVGTEVLIALLFFSTIYIKLSIGLAIFLQVVQISLLAKGLNHTHENNCGCFVNVPKTVTMKHLMYQVILVVLLILYLAIDINYLNGG